ncbi:MAG: hypothetical protein QXT33_05160 [Thermofilum sp.]
MSSEIAKLALRFQKMMFPTVHVLVPKVLFTYLVSSVLREHGDPADANRELFKHGVWSGSTALLHLSSPSALRSLWPKDGRAEGVQRFIEVYGQAAWNIFAGYLPRVSTEAVDKRGFVWALIEENPDKAAFYKVATPEGVDPLYFIAGAYEGATLTAFRLLEVEREWYSMWRPVKGGIAGFYARKTLQVAEVVNYATRRNPSFFELVKWGDSALFAAELLGYEVPSEEAVQR